MFQRTYISLLNMIFQRTHSLPAFLRAFTGKKNNGSVRNINHIKLFQSNVPKNAPSINDGLSRQNHLNLRIAVYDTFGV